MPLLHPKISSLTLRAPAKINLGLIVGKRRADGYHELETILTRVSLFDTVRLKFRFAPKTLVRLSISLALKLPSINLTKGDDNLCVRAAHLFLRHTGQSAQVAISLTKRIPVGAGLGGGSSDAAAILQGLNRLQDKPLRRSELFRLGAELGSDVPFFLTRSPCLAQGRGEILTPITLPELRIILLVPDFAVSTAWAYRALDACRAGTSRLTAPEFSLKIALARLQAGKMRAIGRLLPNSFEDVVFRRQAELAQLKKRLLKAGADAVSLSGSGSAMYVLAQASCVAAVRRILRQAKIMFLSLRTVS